MNSQQTQGSRAGFIPVKKYDSCLSCISEVSSQIQQKDGRQVQNAQIPEDNAEIQVEEIDASIQAENDEEKNPTITLAEDIHVDLKHFNFETERQGLCLGSRSLQMKSENHNRDTDQFTNAQRSVEKACTHITPSQEIKQSFDFRPNSDSDHQEKEQVFRKGFVNKDIFKLTQSSVTFEFEIPQERSRVNSILSNSSRGNRSNTYQNLLKDAQSFYCSICYEEVNIKEMMVLKCEHYFCRSCIAAYLEFMINKSGKVYKIKCPYSICEIKFTQEELKQLINEDTYKRFRRYTLNHEVAASKNKRFCPQIDCEAIIEGKAGQLKTQCPQCSKYFCFRCNLEWHEGKSCKKAQAITYQSWAKSKAINQCPNCLAPVQKEDGCAHMNCVMCSYRWCWVCGKSLDHWIHKIDFSPFSCQRAPQNPKATFMFFLIFVLGGLLLPFIILLLLLSIFIFKGMKPFISINDSLGGCESLWTILLIPIMVPYIGVVAVIASVLSTIASLVLMLPAYAFHIYAFVCTLRWWRRSKLYREESKMYKTSNNVNQV